MILFFQTRAVVTNFTRRKHRLNDITKCICFTHDLLHSIPESAEIEKKTDLQEKDSHNRPTKLDLQRVIRHDKLQEIVTRQSYSGYIFVVVTFQSIVFL